MLARCSNSRHSGGCGGGAPLKPGHGPSPSYCASSTIRHHYFRSTSVTVVLAAVDAPRGVLVCAAAGRADANTEANAERAPGGRAGASQPPSTSPQQQHESRQEQPRQSQLEVYAISDLHTDYAANMAWVEALAAARACGSEGGHACLQSGLIVAGDISHDLGILRRTLQLLVSAYTHVFFIPGNHELWITGGREGGPTDSAAKLDAVLGVCAELGVHTRPTLLGPHLLVAPLHAWHHKSWDTEQDIPGIPRAGPLTISDFSRCRWPSELTGPEGHGGLQLAEWADALNNAVGWPAEMRARMADARRSDGGGNSGSGVGSSNGGSTGRNSASATTAPTTTTTSAERGNPKPLQVISFSHFVPDVRLNPEKRFLTFPNLAKAVGSDPLGERVRRLHPAVHVFGHTHFSWDATLENGVRYVQAPLCYPPERGHRFKSVVLSSQWQPGTGRQQQQQQAGSREEQERSGEQQQQQQQEQAGSGERQQQQAGSREQQQQQQQQAGSKEGHGQQQQQQQRQQAGSRDEIAGSRQQQVGGGAGGSDEEATSSSASSKGERVGSGQAAGGSGQQQGERAGGSNEEAASSSAGSKGQRAGSGQAGGGSGQQQGGGGAGGDAEAEAREKAEHADMAPWLPLLLYRATYTVAMQQPKQQQQQHHGSSAAAAQQQAHGAAAAQQQRQSHDGDGNAAAAQQQAHGVAATQQQPNGSAGSAAAVQQHAHGAAATQQQQLQQSHGGDGSSAAAQQHARNSGVAEKQQQPQHDDGSCGGVPDALTALWRRELIGDSIGDGTSRQHSTASQQHGSTARHHNTAAQHHQEQQGATGDGIGGSTARPVIQDWHAETCPPLGGAMWSRYYTMYARTPEVVELAPWVAQLYSKRRRRMQRQNDERTARECGEAVSGAGDSGGDESDDLALAAAGAAGAAAADDGGAGGAAAAAAASYSSSAITTGGSATAGAAAAGGSAGVGVAGAAAAALPAPTALPPDAASSAAPVGQVQARARAREAGQHQAGALEQAREQEQARVWAQEQEREQEQRQAWRRTMAELEAAERGGGL
ncbi:hypothetical protein FOA52_014032 [Chlamydomonas sp. UWO 241]|nr:hypothetical protein FOA52_014032 [Chlamydomonas sp. UWO 241]